VSAVFKQLLVGYATPHATVLTLVAVLAAAGLAAGLRSADRGQAALAAVAVGVPLALAPLGIDYVITRNLIAAMVPLVVLAAVAASRTRAGPILVAALCSAGIVAFVGVETTPADQRDDWRGVAAAIGPPTARPRYIVVNPSDGPPALELYLPARRVHGSTATLLHTREFDVIDVARDPPLPAVPAAMAGFTPSVIHTDTYTVVRYSAPTPTPVYYTQLAALALLARAGSSILTDG
jgi:hypothetical protein